ncbi:MAG: trigger factor [Actinomycetota bacterium]
MESALQTISEAVEKGRVKLRVEVPENALDPAVTAVYRKWADEIKVPGFRKGKVPRQIIDQRLGGPQAAREEALKDALPDFYREALVAEELEAIAPPDIDIVSFEPGSPLVFEATIDVRPEVKVPDLEGITIDAPSDEVTDDELTEQLDRLRDRFAELETVSREARRGDHVLIDLKGYHHDEPVEGASAPDFLYELGSRTGPPKLDDELEGNRAGAILKFTETMPEDAGDLAGKDVSFTVLIKEVKAKNLPALDDDFAKTVGEFDTLDELREDLRARLAEVKEGMVHEQIQRLALEALVSAADLEPPDKLVEGEFAHRLEHFQEDLKRAKITMEDYARASDLTELELRQDIRRQAQQSVKAELLLEEIARDQSLEISEEDIGREIAVAAARAQRDPKELAEQIVASGSLGAVAADIMRRKALDYVVRTINVTGRPADEQSSDEEATVEANP